MRQRWGLATVIVALLAPWPATSAGASAQSDHEVLTALAHRYLHDRATRVTAGFVPLDAANRAVLTGVGAARAFSQRIAAETAELDRLRARFAATLTEFSHAQVTIEHAETTVAGGVAELRLTETTDLYLAARGRSADAPSATSYRLGHTLRFDRSGGAWLLSADVLRLPQDALDPIPYVNAQKSDPPARQEKPTGPGIPAGMVAATPDGPRKPRAATDQLTPAAPFNRQAAVDYAKRWAKDRNLFEYNVYGNDCANFLSQIFRNGGWTNVGSINEPDGPDKWWINYPSIYPTDSRTWPISHELAAFGWYYSQRLRPYANEPARQGDAIFADWDNASGAPGTDQHLDHSMFITALLDPWDWEGIFVSYHTVDQLNISMGAVVEKVRARGNPSFGGVYYFMDTR
ncbi:amidase domain-containing protein [Allorhizocola rhizosphaerae]|uniref:amidase domain-containing protein n=1 Tax=Allorhizocola rhizosphaerae TaxID=1872709 RepID=UPI000E3BD293|nr:amidase domain-containing protein [Allorhizocola rhizosphaerae]